MSQVGVEATVRLAQFYFYGGGVECPQSLS